MVLITRHAEEVMQNKIEMYPEYLISQIFKNVTEGILITDQQKRILTINPAFEEATGYILADVYGQTPKILQSGVHEKSFYDQMWASIRERDFWEGEIWNRKKTGELYPEKINIFAIRNQEGEITNYCGIFTDISEQKTIEHELKKQQDYDQLTEIRNRHNFVESMSRLLHNSAPSNRHAIFFLDLERFNQINETLGHAIGDILLVEVAHCLKRILKNSDIVARYAGDQFVFTATNITTPRDAAILADAIKAECEKGIEVDGKKIIVTPSIGISLFPEDGVTIDELLTRAEKAMLFAKSNEKTGFSFFFDELNTNAQNGLVLDQQLRIAIEQDEFELYYQPKIDLKTLRIVGVEALVRWRNETLGFISPNDFIPYAEETGLIIPISEMIFEKAFEQYKKIAAIGFEHISVAINVSSIHFAQKDFLESIKSILERTNMSAQNFEIEVTERTVMSNAEETISKLVRLKQLGFKLSIDDFGTGYSSLSYLIKFPLDVLKIDRSFIQHITSLDEKQAIVDAIIQMAHRLKMNVVAEGVESGQQAALLSEMGCDYVQGYYYSKPVPLDELLELLPYWEYEHEERN